MAKHRKKLHYRHPAHYLKKNGNVPHPGPIQTAAQEAKMSDPVQVSPFETRTRAIIDTWREAFTILARERYSRD